ncbi:acetylglutamate kinase [Chloroflexota bacterium]
MDNVIVVKIGGATFGSHDAIIEDIARLQQQGKSLVVVHGGANMVTQWLTRLGVPTTFIEGERVTDEETLKVVTAVLAGLVNKEIVAQIIENGGRAVGICGVDGALIGAKIRSQERGYVGAVVKVNPDPLVALIGAGYIPVVAPLSLHAFERPDESPRLLNINGDTVAGEIAAALGAESLILLTDVDGICDSIGELIPELTAAAAEALLLSGVASGGMVPKVRACLTALTGTSRARIIDGRQPHALLKEIEEGGGGTTIGR